MSSSNTASSAANLSGPTSIGPHNTPNAPIGTVATLANALENTQILNAHLDIVAGVWDLAQTEKRIPDKTHHYVYSTPKPRSEEAVFDQDDRKLVSPAEFGPKGKYRGIVKLFLHYEGQGADSDNWGMGTGWLIAPDLLVTAGHCAYDWGHKLGCLTKAKVFMGYNGKNSIGKDGVQFRCVKRVATPAEWLKGPTRTYDVSYMLLDEPFDVEPKEIISYEDTPEKGREVLGVVGYPGDLDKGEHMYADFQETKFDLARDNRLLTYTIDTYGGNSGSPVLRGKDNVSIGVHAYGGEFNQASVIGPMGNIFSHYIHAIRSPALKATTSAGIHFVRANKPTPSAGLAVKAPTYWPTSWDNGLPRPLHTAPHCPRCHTLCTTSDSPVDHDTESFLSILKTGLNIGGGLAGMAGPIGGIAGMAMKMVGGLIPESAGLGDVTVSSGAAESAAFGEAALQALCKMDGKVLQQLGIFDIMKSNVVRIAPAYMNAAPVLLPKITSTALNVVVNSNQQQSQTESFSSFSCMMGSSKADQFVASGPHLANPQHRLFVDSLAKASKKSGNSEAESAFLKTVASIAVKGSADVASKFVQEGLDRVRQWAQRRFETESMLTGAAGGTESAALVGRTPAPLEGMVERAILAHAAGEAVLKVPSHVLEAEGFFSSLCDTIKRVAPVVIKHGPTIIGNVGSIINAGRGGTESFMDVAPAGLVARPAPSPVSATLQPQGPIQGDREQLQQRLRALRFARGPGVISGGNGDAESIMGQKFFGPGFTGGSQWKTNSGNRQFGNRHIGPPGFYSPGLNVIGPAPTGGLKNASGSAIQSFSAEDQNDTEGFFDLISHIVPAVLAAI